VVGVTNTDSVFLSVVQLRAIRSLWTTSQEEAGKDLRLRFGSNNHHCLIDEKKTALRK